MGTMDDEYRTRLQSTVDSVQRDLIGQGLKQTHLDMYLTGGTPLIGRCGSREGDSGWPDAENRCFAVGRAADLVPNGCTRSYELSRECSSMESRLDQNSFSKDEFLYVCQF